MSCSANQSRITRLLSRIHAKSDSDFYVSIVSFHEPVAGWYAYLNRARTSESIVRAYSMFGQILSDFSEMSVAPFTMDAAAEFARLRTEKVRIGTMDLRIASIALSSGWTLLSRNQVDFEKVPGLSCEDWTAR